MLKKTCHSFSEKKLHQIYYLTNLLNQMLGGFLKINSSIISCATPNILLYTSLIMFVSDCHRFLFINILLILLLLVN